MITRPQVEVLGVLIKNLPSFQAANMSFLRNGVRFISAVQGHELGDDKMQLLLTLLDTPAAAPKKGREVSVTPEGVRVNRPTGIGTEFPWQMRPLTQR